MYAWYHYSTHAAAVDGEEEISVPLTPVPLYTVAVVQSRCILLLLLLLLYCAVYYTTLLYFNVMYRTVLSTVTVVLCWYRDIVRFGLYGTLMT